MPFAPGVEVFDPMMDNPRLGTVVDTMPFADPVSVVVRFDDWWAGAYEEVIPVQHLEEVQR